jgi:hypothetical protein
MDKRILLLGLLLIVNGPTLAKPRIGLTEALRLAERYVREHKIENSGRFLAGATWDPVTGYPEKSCWSIIWDWDSNEAVMVDAQLVVRVCDDGKKIHHQDKWA